MERQRVITALRRPLGLTCVAAPENVTNCLLRPARYVSDKRVSAYMRPGRAAPFPLTCTDITRAAEVPSSKVMLFVKCSCQI